jgi:hypothetical protein
VTFFGFVAASFKIKLCIFLDWEMTMNASNLRRRSTGSNEIDLPNAGEVIAQVFGGHDDLLESLAALRPSKPALHHSEKMRQEQHIEQEIATSPEDKIPLQEGSVDLDVAVGELYSNLDRALLSPPHADLVQSDKKPEAVAVTLPTGQAARTVEPSMAQNSSSPEVVRPHADELRARTKRSLAMPTALTFLFCLALALLPTLFLSGKGRRQWLSMVLPLSIAMTSLILTAMPPYLKLNSFYKADKVVSRKSLIQKNAMALIISTPAIITNIMDGFSLGRMVPAYLVSLVAAFFLDKALEITGCYSNSKMLAPAMSPSNGSERGLGADHSLRNAKDGRVVNVRECIQPT